MLPCIFLISRFRNVNLSLHATLFIKNFIVSRQTRVSAKVWFLRVSGGLAIAFCRSLAPSPSFVYPPPENGVDGIELPRDIRDGGWSVLRYVTRGSRSRGRRPGANRDTSRRVSAAFVRKTASGPQENIPKAKMEQQERLPDPRFLFNDRDRSTAEGESIELSCTPSSSSPRVAIPIIMKPRLSKQILFLACYLNSCLLGSVSSGQARGKFSVFVRVFFSAGALTRSITFWNVY